MPTTTLVRKVFIPKTPKELFHCFSNRLGTMIEGEYGVLGAVEFEDGSGYSFNVKFSGKTKWHYIKFPKQ